MHKLDNRIQVKYKYALSMPNRIDTLKSILNKWSNLYLDKIYYGQLLLLVSPIYLFKNDIYVQPLVDIDDKFENAFYQVKDFINKNSKRKAYWISEFSGKNSFHLVARFAIKVKKYDLDYIRNLIFEPLKDLSKENIDIISSVRDVPVVRLGYRKENTQLSFPVFPILDYNNINEIKKHIKKSTFIDVFKNKEELSNYIKNYMFPLFYIEEKDYVKYI